MDAIISNFSSRLSEDEDNKDQSDNSAIVKPTREEAEAAVHTLLRWIGDNPEREGLRDTPARVVKAYEEIFNGYQKSADAELGRTFEEISGYDDLVLIKDIPFYSHCEHHMVPVIGKAHIAYLPEGKVVGLSKLARVVDIFAHRLQTQEAMTSEISSTIQNILMPRGVAVLLEAEHMCMSMRGIRKQGMTTLTSAFTGEFKSSLAEQTRFFNLVNQHRPA